jgi:CSLREA domain-containing protein
VWIDRRSVLATVGATLATAFFAASAQADDTFTVTRTDDPTPAACLPSDCSLREAVIAANSDSDLDTINLPAGQVYTLSITGPGDAQQGDLDITHSLWIKKSGNGNDPVIYANGGATQDRALEIQGGETQLFDIHVSGGVAPADGGPPQAKGGDIRVDSAAAIVTHGGAITGGMAPGNVGQGGGVYNQGRADFNRTNIAGNTALKTVPSDTSGVGGGVFTNGASATTLLFESVVSANQAGVGGGLGTLVSGGAGSVTVEDSEITGNTSTSGTGGGAFAGLGTSLSLTNATVDGNHAPDNGGSGGGGLFALGSTVNILASTISGNNADDGGGGIAAEAFGTPASVTLSNSILAGNTDSGSTPPDEPDCLDVDNPTSGTQFHTLGYNIIGNNTGCGLHAATGDQLGTSVSPVDPKLGPLGFHGGPLLAADTFALQAGSPAINAGDPSASGACDPSNGVAFDARGVPRTVGKRCDIGAYELAKCRGVLIDLVGTNQADDGTSAELTPSSAADGYLGLDGNDSQAGGGGNDGLCGGNGKDSLSGNGGDDALDGGNGGDTLGGMAGNDKLSGRKGKDKLSGGSGKDHLSGGPGDDHLVGGPGKDVCVGGPGHDTATGCEVKHSIP